MLELIGFSILIMCASLAGIVSVWKHAGTFIERNLSLLVSFSAGVFLIIALTLALETIEHAHDIFSGLVWLGTGAAGLWILFYLLPNFHHHHDTTIEKTHRHSRLDARRIVISDAIHNIGDGILLAAAFAINIPFGIATALSIFAHELVQEISEFFVLKQAGFSSKKALIVNFAVSSTILIGALGGYFLLEQFEHFEIPLLGIAAGAFFVVVLNDLIPHSVRHSHAKKSYLPHLIWFIIGMILMFAVQSVTSHEHEHTTDSHAAVITEESFS